MNMMRSLRSSRTVVNPRESGSGCGRLSQKQFDGSRQRCRATSESSGSQQQVTTVLDPGRQESVSEGCNGSPLSNVVSYQGRYTVLPTNRSNNRVAELAGLVGVSTHVAASMVNKQPGLLTTPLDKTRATYLALPLLLNLTSVEAADLVARHPSLLVLSADNISAGLVHVSTVLGVEEQLVVQLVCKQPYILETPAEVINGKFNSLCNCLPDMARTQVFELIAKLPTLLFMSEDRIHCSIRELCELFDTPTQKLLPLLVQQPQLLTKRMGSLMYDLELISSSLQVPVSTVTHLLTSLPTVMNAPLPVLRTNFDALCGYFVGVSRQQVVELVINNPALLPLTLN